MNFDFEQIESLMDELGAKGVERDIVEYGMLKGAEYENKYGDTQYEVPLACIDLSSVSKMLEDERHPALITRRTSKYTADEFPEFDYGDDDEQPTFAQVFADYLNLVTETTTHAYLSQLQDEGIVEVSFGEKGFVYHVVEGEEETELIKGAIDYAGIFL